MTEAINPRSKTVSPIWSPAAAGASGFTPGTLLGDLSDFALDQMQSGKRKTAEDAVRWAGLILCTKEEKFNFRRVLRDVKRRMNTELSLKRASASL